MPYTDEQLSAIYDRTSGYCHICGKKLAFQNYGRPGRKGAWQVEHSNPRVKGGSDRLTNLFAACIDCNLSKATSTTRTARRWYGRNRAPLSRDRRRQAQLRNAIAGGFLN